MAPALVRPATSTLQPATRAGQPHRAILPTSSLRPRTVQPAVPARPHTPQPILPKSSAAAPVRPLVGDAFTLPANLTLKPRGSGQPLPGPIQKKMESFFNTSFSDVRVHVGPEAPAIGALAFTHGSQLYFAPGQYNPHSMQGQQLLGHELTHVVQQCAGRVRNPLGPEVAVVHDPALEAEAHHNAVRAGASPSPIQSSPVHRMLGSGGPKLRSGSNRSTLSTNSLHRDRPVAQRLEGPSPKSKVIQRDIGFEIEVAGCGSREPYRLAILGRQRYRMVKKGAVLVRGVGFTLQGEENANSTASHIEFVTTPFPETAAGRAALQTTMTSIRNMMNRLNGAGPVNQHVAVNQLVGPGVIGLDRPNIEIMNRLNPLGRMQVTAAIRLDRIHSLFTDLGSQVPALAPPAAAPAKALFTGGRRARYAQFTQNANAAIARYQNVMGVQPSDELKGVLTLVGHYIRQSRQTYDYPKAMAFFLMRSDLATAYAQIPEAAFLTRAFWVELAALAGAENNLERLMLKPDGGWLARKRGHLTVRRWLEGIHGGVDLLTRNTYPVHGTRPSLHSMGSLGNQTEPVGAPAAPVNAPIMEIRTVQTDRPVNEWEAMSLDIFDNLVAINQGGAFPVLQAPLWQVAVVGPAPAVHVPAPPLAMPVLPLAVVAPVPAPG